MAEFKLKSGATLVVSMAAFQDGNGLRKAVARSAAVREPGDYIGEAAAQSLLADDGIEIWVFTCAKKAIYEGAKVSADLFDDPKLGAQARGDYFEIVSKILEVNLNPFFVTAFSESKTPQAAAA